MIDKALIFVRNSLNTYLKNTTNSEEDKVVLSNILTQEGSADHLPDSTVVITLINVEEERVHKAQVPYVKESNGSFLKVNPEIKLNLHLLFTTNFTSKNYDQSLKFLGHVFRFFQARNTFDHRNSPALDEEIEKLIFELSTLPFEQLNHIWGYLGAKYTPSVIYKMRMLTVQQRHVLEEIEASQTIGSDISNNN